MMNTALLVIACIGDQICRSKRLILIAFSSNVSLILSMMLKWFVQTARAGSPPPH